VAEAAAQGASLRRVSSSAEGSPAVHWRTTGIWPCRHIPRKILVKTRRCIPAQRHVTQLSPICQGPQLGMAQRQNAGRSMLALDGLTCRFGEAVAVQSVSLEFEQGAFVGIIGRSGAGKSTLLRAINRLVDPAAGRVTYRGVDVTALRGADLRTWRARAAMIFQQFNLVPRLDVLTNVMLGRIARHRIMARGRVVFDGTPAALVDAERAGVRPPTPLRRVAGVAAKRRRLQRPRPHRRAKRRRHRSGKSREWLRA
jgi:ABC-type multidrug transport system fused ATPase/permease subunit